MVDKFVRLPSDGAGKRIQTFENTVGGEVVHAEGVVNVDASGNPVVLATEAKLEAVRALLSSISGRDFSTQTTLAALLTAFNAEDFATESTLSSLLGKIDDGGGSNVLTKLTDIHNALVGLSLEAESIDLSNSSIHLAVDELEDLMRQVRDAIQSRVGATTDPEATGAGSLIAVVKRLRTLLGNLDGKAQANTITKRMLDKSPAVGYELWYDTSQSDAVIITEAPSGQTDESALVWRGINMPLDANGNVVGRVIERDGFAWDSRLTGWV